MAINTNEIGRQVWLASKIAKIPAGARILDAGAGEQKNRVHCGHLSYVSQDFCQYSGKVGEEVSEGLQVASWDTTLIDLVSDIASIPADDCGFDAILCSEVLEHVPEPQDAIQEFFRLLKPNGILIITAPFASNVHMAPHYFYSGFSRFWYQHHLEKHGFQIKELTPNGDWFAFLRQEISRLGGVERVRKSWTWPLAYLYALIGRLYFAIRPKTVEADLACFGWHCLAVKKDLYSARPLTQK